MKSNKILKYIIIVFIFAVIGALVFRVIMSSDKSVFDHFEITDASKQAYNEAGDLTVYTMEFKNRTADNGYFCAYSLYYVKETGELQVTVRYNKSAVGYVGAESTADLEFFLMTRQGENLSESGPASSAEESGSRALNKKYSGTYYKPYKVETDSRYGLYEFRKLYFENVTLTGDACENEDVVVVMVPTGTPLPTEENATSIYSAFYDRQNMHYTAQPFDTYKLSRKNIKALES